MKPGIESQVKIDNTHLYDDESIGKTSGSFVSLARALADPESEDAIRWNEMRSKTSKTLTAGAITAGVGAVGSLVANMAVNSGNENQSGNILSQYDSLKADHSGDNNDQASSVQNVSNPDGDPTSVQPTETRSGSTSTRNNPLTGALTNVGRSSGTRGGNQSGTNSLSQLASTLFPANANEIKQYGEEVIEEEVEEEPIESPKEFTVDETGTLADLAQKLNLPETSANPRNLYDYEEVIEEEVEEEPIRRTVDTKLAELRNNPKTYMKSVYQKDISDATANIITDFADAALDIDQYTRLVDITRIGRTNDGKTIYSMTLNIPSQMMTRQDYQKRFDNNKIYNRFEQSNKICEEQLDEQICGGTNKNLCAINYSWSLPGADVNNAHFRCVMQFEVLK